MSKHNTFFKNVMKFAGRAGIRFHDLRTMGVFIWAIVGVIQNHRPRLSLSWWRGKSSEQGMTILEMAA